MRGDGFGASLPHLDTVVVEFLSRLSRSSQDLLALLSVWQEKGINLVSCRENIDMGSWYDLFDD
ncbi:recombinase family protein [Paenibacillus koleovorans]|uniref:recombinase family protein n=1 Tax=Paenibacillus koleovorans TaxID=121608 RepID=UPI000FD84A68